MALSRKALRTWACSMLVFVLIGCSTSADEQDSAEITGVSDAMVADAARFQAAGGLFLMPEATAAEVTSFIATAHYAGAPDAVAGVVDWPKAAANPLPESADLAESDAYLQVVTAAGGAGIDPSTLERLTDAIVLPPVQGDPGGEIGALWLWSDAVSRLSAFGVDVEVDPAAAARVADIPTSALVGHPYLVRRLAEVYDHLSTTPPPAVAALVGELSTAALPSTIDSTSDVLDLLAIVRDRAAEGTPVDLPAETRDLLVDLARGPEGADDLLVSAVAEILSLAGADDGLAAVTAPLGPRVDGASGLIGPAGAAVGSVNATYLFARLVDLRFAEIASTATRDALDAAAADAQVPMGARIEAVAALKNAGDDRWEGYRSLATEAAAAQPTTIDQAGLGDYLQIMEPAVQVDPAITTARLTPFDPGADESVQRLAWAALRLSYLFSNASEVSAMFDALQRQMKGWADDPATPFPLLLAAAAIIPGSRVVSADSTYLDALGSRVAGHRGCRDAATFFALDGTRGGVCSVILTLQSRGVPGGAS